MMADGRRVETNPYPAESWDPTFFFPDASGVWLTLIRILGGVMMLIGLSTILGQAHQYVDFFVAGGPMPSWFWQGVWGAVGAVAMWGGAQLLFRGWRNGPRWQVKIGTFVEEHENITTAIGFMLYAGYIAAASVPLNAFN